MKITLKEYDGCFSFDMEAETMEDASALVRFAMNHTSEIKSSGTNVGQSGSFESHLVLGKRKQFTSVVPKAR